jgi:hypothetical protein
MQYHLRARQRLADQLAVAGQNDAFDPKRDIGIDPITVLASACGQAFCLPEGCPRNGRCAEFAAYNCWQPRAIGRHFFKNIKS